MGTKITVQSLGEDIERTKRMRANAPRMYQALKKVANVYNMKHGYGQLSSEIVDLLASIDGEAQNGNT